jgi:hypothetical protein
MSSVRRLTGWLLLVASPIALLVLETVGGRSPSGPAGTGPPRTARSLRQRRPASA